MPWEETTSCAIPLALDVNVPLGIYLRNGTSRHFRPVSLGDATKLLTDPRIPRNLPLWFGLYDRPLCILHASGVP